MASRSSRRPLDGVGVAPVRRSEKKGSRRGGAEGQADVFGGHGARGGVDQRCGVIARRQPRAEQQGERVGAERRAHDSQIMARNS
jgi:hypothetical protein